MRDLELIEEIARGLHDSSFDHGWPHVERVLRRSLELVKCEGMGLDEELVRLAALLHDLGRAVGDPHALYSSLIAEMLLEELGYDKRVISEIAEAIKLHSYSYARSLGGKPSGLAAILSDADKLDALGIVGFLRVFIYGERRGRGLDSSIEHFYEKILRLRGELVTSCAKREGERLTQRVEMLLGMLYEELGIFNGDILELNEEGREEKVN